MRSLLATLAVFVASVSAEAQTSDLGALALAPTSGCVHGPGGCTPQLPPPHEGSWDPHPVILTIEGGNILWSDGSAAHDASPDVPPTKICIGYCPGSTSGKVLPWFVIDPWTTPAPGWVEDRGYYNDPSQGGGGSPPTPPDSFDPRRPVMTRPMGIR